MKIKFAKLENGRLIPAPNPMQLGDRLICNPTREQYASCGWLPVIRTNPPELPLGQRPVSRWEAADGGIRQVWESGPLPEPQTPEPSLEERLVRNETMTRENRGMIEAIANGAIGPAGSGREVLS